MEYVNSDGSFDEHRNKEAYGIFWGLLFTHIVLGFVKYHTMHVARYWWDKLAIFMFITIWLMCFLCSNWIFVTDRDTSQLSERQKSFETMIFIEFLCCMATILAGALFAIFVTFTKPVLNMFSMLLDKDGYGDFMETYSIMMSQHYNLFCGCFIPLFMGYARYDGEDSLMLAIGFMAIF